MILKEKIFAIGRIIKPHGVHGEMSFSFTTDVFDTADAPFIIIEREGIPVPFFIESYRFKSDTTALLKLQDVDTEEYARTFSGVEVYLPDSYSEKIVKNEPESEYFVGFLLVDEEAGEIGRVSEIDHTTSNVLFVVDKADDELLIPVGEDYIISVDHENKKIILRLPEGLLDL